MNIIKKIIKKAYIVIFNIINNTHIYSLNASMKANYGKGIRIDSNVYIAEDVVIGDYSYVNTNSSIENCVIGKYVSISSGVNISPWEHPLGFLSTHPIAYTADFLGRKRKKTIIGNDVLISLNCIILEGIEIGDGAVIGAGAVVTKDVLPYEIVAGVPAKHIGYRFSDKNIREKIQGMNWWDLNESDIKNLMEKFNLDDM